MGIRFVEAEEGGATTVMDYKEELTRIGCILLGGIIFTAIDYTGSYAVRGLGLRKPSLFNFQNPHEINKEISFRI
jgi:acyl-CoA thioesterase